MLPAGFPSEHQVPFPSSKGLKYLIMTGCGMRDVRTGIYTPFSPGLLEIWSTGMMGALESLTLKRTS